MTAWEKFGSGICVFLISLYLVGTCLAQEALGGQSAENILPGKWLVEEGGNPWQGEAIFSFKSDGTFVAKVLKRPFEVVEVRGKWRIEKGMLVREFMVSEAFPKASERQDKIDSVEAAQVNLSCKEGKVYPLKRLKDFYIEGGVFRDGMERETKLYYLVSLQGDRVLGFSLAIKTAEGFRIVGIPPGYPRERSFVIFGVFPPDDLLVRFEFYMPVVEGGVPRMVEDPEKAGRPMEPGTKVEGQEGLGLELKHPDDRFGIWWRE